MADSTDAVLIALRRIIRATDICSQKLRKTVGLTTPQSLVLRTVAQSGGVSLGRIARNLSLSQATVTTLVDRLDRGEFIERVRSEEDRRRVFVRLTTSGNAVIFQAPDLLQDRFVARLEGLRDGGRSMIAAALQRTAALMDASELDASPVLLTGELAGNTPGE